MEELLDGRSLTCSNNGQGMTVDVNRGLISHLDLTLVSDNVVNV